MKGAAFALAFALATSANAQDPVVEDTEADLGDAAEQQDMPAPTLGHDPEVVDTVLPSGIRVILAHDGTLPVASVVLALETGTEDDPSDRPGLVHTLAYHLQQGNRELPPEGVARLAHDGGGITSMAVGPAQIRYESLVPVSLLDDMLWAESHRLRSPSVDEALWHDTLAWARRDARRNRALSFEALAALHDAEGLSHAGRNASPDVRAMTPRAVAHELSDRMDYARATLVVVSPLEPQEVLERIREHFADLPDANRRVNDRFSPPHAADGPRQFAQPQADGSVFAWPVPPGTEGLEQARVLCRTFNRQRRTKNEPTKARLRCHFDEDPRRAALVVRATGTDDPLELLRVRLARIAEGEDDRLIEQQAQAVANALALEISTPLGMARRLAMADSRTRRETSPSTLRPLSELTGIASWIQPSALREVIRRHYRMESALQIVPTKESEAQAP